MGTTSCCGASCRVFQPMSSHSSLWSTSTQWVCPCPRCVLVAVGSCPWGGSVHVEVMLLLDSENKPLEGKLPVWSRRRVNAGAQLNSFCTLPLGGLPAGHTFREVKTAYVRLLDERMEEVVQYPLAETPNSTGLVVCALHRSTMGWRLVAMGKPATGNMARVSSSFCGPSWGEDPFSANLECGASPVSAGHCPTGGCHAQAHHATSGCGSHQSFHPCETYGSRQS